jgi:hypothetical protein
MADISTLPAVVEIRFWTAQKAKGEERKWPGEGRRLEFKDTQLLGR